MLVLHMRQLGSERYRNLPRTTQDINPGRMVLESMLLTAALPHHMTTPTHMNTDTHSGPQLHT